jgi:hypothetical protein
VNWPRVHSGIPDSHHKKVYPCNEKVVPLWQGTRVDLPREFFSTTTKYPPYKPFTLEDYPQLAQEDIDWLNDRFGGTAWERHCCEMEEAKVRGEARRAEYARLEEVGRIQQRDLDRRLGVLVK